jgi:hypothetical protein
MRLFLASTVRPGFAASGWIRASDDAEPESALRVRFAFHGSPVVAKGWAPFDHPDASAYVPLSLEQLDVEDVAGVGRFMLERAPRRERILAERAGLELARAEVYARLLGVFLDAVVPLELARAWAAQVLARLDESTTS